jgi:protein JSN1
MSSSRSDHPTLGYLPPTVSLPRSGSSTANTSPTEPSNAGSLRSPFLGALNATGKMAGSTRSGAGSPSHDLGGSSRLFSKRYALLFGAHAPTSSLRHG